MQKNIIKKESGYTIIETMIAVSLFIIIVMSGLGALLNANLLHQKSQNMRSIMDNLSFIMEDMGRNLRTGYHYQCFDVNHQILSPATLGASQSCPSGWAIAFEIANGNPSTYADQWVYYISNDGKIFKSADGAQSFVQLTPDEVMINSTSSGFSVLGAEPPDYTSPPGDQQQPFVILRLVGNITFKNVVTPFSLQTSVSQRLVDI
jgi:Tfp pilus assembly protein PilW